MSDSNKDNKKDIAIKKLAQISDFSKLNNLLLNDYHTFLTKKVERLTSALYVITGFLSHEEPIRSRLRSSALDLIGQSSHPANLSKEGVELFRARCTEIGTMLQAARSAGLISGMNADLLCEEYAHLATFVKENFQEIRETPKEDTDVVVSQSSQLNNKTKIKNDDFFYRKVVKDKGQNKIRSVKGQIDRRNTILELFNKKDKISIRDAMLVIDGCSEKTIQRELLSLVQEGIVIKEGERRWSIYRKGPAFPASTPET